MLSFTAGNISEKVNLKQKILEKFHKNLKISNPLFETDLGSANKLSVN